MAYDAKALEVIGKRATLNFPELLEDQNEDDGYAQAPEVNKFCHFTMKDFIKVELRRIHI